MYHNFFYVIYFRLIASDIGGNIIIWDRRSSNYPSVELTTNPYTPITSYTASLNSVQLDVENQVSKLNLKSSIFKKKLCYHFNLFLFNEWSHSLISKKLCLGIDVVKNENPSPLCQGECRVNREVSKWA